MSANDHTIEAGPCYRCKCPIRLPAELYQAAKRSPRISFWCPYGHEQHFLEGESEETRLRRERDRLVQRLAEKDDDIAWQRKRAEEAREAREAAERRAAAARGQVTKLKKRASNGVCPCCNRTFSDLARHMATKHPTFLAEEVPGDGVAKH